MILAPLLKSIFSADTEYSSWPSERIFAASANFAAFRMISWDERRFTDTARASFAGDVRAAWQSWKPSVVDFPIYRLEMNIFRFFSAFTKRR